MYPTFSPVPQARPFAALAAVAATVACLLASAPAAHAAQSKPTLAQDVPTLIDSDSLEYDDARQVSVFSGNVVLTRGDMILRAERLEMRQEPDGSQFGTATAGPGKQVFIRQARTGTVEVVEGTADRAEYDGRADRTHFIGHAVVNRMACGQLLDQIRGERVSYDQGAGVYTATGGAQAGTPSKRVRTTLQSRQHSDAVIASCPSPAKTGAPAAQAGAR